MRDTENDLTTSNDASNTGLLPFPDGLLSFPVVHGEYELIKGHSDRVPRRRRVVYLRASTEAIDHEDEVVDVSALTKGAPYYVKNGWLDWNHYSQPARFPDVLAKAGQIPAEFIIGRPLEFKTDNREAFIKGYLHEKRKAADTAWELIQADPGRIRASVGGGYLSRRREFSKSEGKFINRVMEVHWNHTAICPEGINSATEASAAPFGPFAKAFQDLLRPICCPDGCAPGGHCKACGRAEMAKALSTNGMGGSTSFAGMMPEDLEGAGRKGKGSGLCAHMSGPGMFKSMGSGLDHMVECLNMAPERACGVVAMHAIVQRQHQ